MTAVTHRSRHVRWRTGMHSIKSSENGGPMSSAFNFEFVTWRSREGLITFATGMMALAFAFASARAAADVLAIESVSNRADLVSGGDVLVRITLPTGVTQA